MVKTKIPSPSQIALRQSLLKRVIFLSLYLAISTSIITAVAGYVMAGRLLRERTLNHLSILASIRKDALEEVLRSEREAVAHIAARGDIRVAKSAVAAERAAQDALQDLRDVQGEAPSGITIFDRSGRVLGSAGLPIDSPSTIITATHVLPVIREGRWEGNVVFSMLPGGRVLATHNEIKSLLPLFFNVSSLGVSADITLAVRGNLGKITFIHGGQENAIAEEWTIAEAAERFPGVRALSAALLGSEGIGEEEKSSGEDVYVAYRTLPMFKGALSISLHRKEALMGLEVLSGFLAAINAFILGSATVFSVLLARRVTRGLHHLAKKVRKLAPGHWTFPRTIQTGDEVELLDAVVADLTLRLRDTFISMEDEIAVRTSDLQKQFTQDRAILETIEHGVILFNAAGKITGANPAAERLLCVRSGSLQNKSIVESLPLRTHRKTFVGSSHPIAHCLDKHQRFHQRPDTHLCVIRGDGTLLPVLLVVSPLLEKGKCTGGIAVFQDVTEERQLDYMKSEFISLASHQLRTPLSSILWYIELLADKKATKLTSEQRSYVREMQTSAERMTGLIDALLQVSRLEGGGIRANQKSVDLRQFLQSIAEESKELAKERGVAITFHSSGRSVKLKTDATLLSVVMQNILSNAVKYSKIGGQIVISLEARRGCAEIIVEDSGIGIPDREQQHLFQKLFRADNVHKVDATGSGLGLYISRMVMGTLGGSISLKSRENKGTVVTVRLPMKKGK